MDNQLPTPSAGRSYRAPLSKQLLPFIILIPLSFVLFRKGHLGTSASLSTWMTVVGGLLFVVYSLVGAAFTKVELLPGKLVKRELFARKEINRSEILEIRRRSIGLVIFVHRSDFLKSLVIPKGIAGDEAWDAWMSNIKGRELLR